MKSFNYALVLLFLVTVAAHAQQRILRHMDETEAGITAPALNELVSVTAQEEPTGKLRIGMGGSDSLPVIALLDLDDIPRIIPNIHAALEDVTAYKHADGTATVVATVGVLPNRVKSASATSVDFFGAAFGMNTVAGFWGAAFGNQTVAGDYGAAFGFNTVAGLQGAAFGESTTAGIGGAAFGRLTAAGTYGAAFGHWSVAGTSGFAAGTMAKGANGSFVFADSQVADFVRTDVTDGFGVRAQGGAYFAVPTLAVTGEVSAETFVGDGSGLTGLGIRTSIDTANRTLVAADCYNGVIYVTSAATLTLPPVASGMSVTIIAAAAVAVTVAPNPADLIRLDGTALNDGDRIFSGSTAAEVAVLTYYDSTGWYANTDGWTYGQHFWDPGGADTDDDTVGGLALTKTGTITRDAQGWTFGTGTANYFERAGGFPNASSYAIAVWAKPDKTTMDTQTWGGWIIADRNPSLTGFDFTLAYHKEGAGSLRFELYDQTAAVVYSATASAAVLHDTWVHLFAVADFEQSEMRLYVNGTLDATTAIPADAKANVFGNASTRARIGTTSWGTPAASLQYRGVLDKLRFYDNFVPSDQFIWDIYQWDGQAKGLL